MQEHLSLIRRRKEWDLSDGDGEEAMSLMNDLEIRYRGASQLCASASAFSMVPQSQPWLAAREGRQGVKKDPVIVKAWYWIPISSEYPFSIRR